jgi:hypothetical protein
MLASGLGCPPSTNATALRTNSGPSCRWLRMIPSLGTNATIFRDFSTTLYDAAPVRERNVVRQLIDRRTPYRRSLVTWRGLIRRMSGHGMAACSAKRPFIRKRHPKPAYQFGISSGEGAYPPRRSPSIAGDHSRHEICDPARQGPAGAPVGSRRRADHRRPSPLRRRPRVNNANEAAPPKERNDGRPQNRNACYARLEGRASPILICWVRNSRKTRIRIGRSPPCPR